MPIDGSMRTESEQKDNHGGPGEKPVSVKMNMVMNMILTMSNFVFPFITFPYVSRVLLPAGNGKVIFATSVVNYFAMFVQLGIPMYGVRACAKVRDDKQALSRVVHELLFINLFMTVLVYAAYAVALAAVPRFREDLPLFLIVGSTILLNAIGVEWLYKGLEKYTYITVRSILFKLVAIVAMFLFVHAQKDYVIYGGISIFAASASNVLNFFNLRKYIFVKPLGGYNWKQHMKPVMVFFAMTVATTIYTNLDNVMLGFMTDDVQVGLYGAAVKIKMILLSVVTSASTVLLPRASYYVDNGQMEEFYRILKKTMHFIVMMALAFSVYFMLYAGEGILFLSGDEYEGAALPMQIIMPTLFLIGITNVTGIQMLVPLGREKQVLYSEIAGAVCDLILNAVLIPFYGAVGAAIGTLVAEIVVLFWQLCSIRDIPCRVFEQVPWLRLILVTAMGCAACFWVKLLELSVFPALVLSAGLFFGVYGTALLAMGDQIARDLVGTVRGKLRRRTG